LTRSRTVPATPVYITPGTKPWDAENDHSPSWLAAGSIRLRA
jgi:hypothetical protein